MRPSIILRDAILRANKIIHQTSKTQPQCEGMGTTVVACLFYDNKVSVAHVGDSRLYRLRNDRFEQVTMDHSLLAGARGSRVLFPGRSAARHQQELRHACARRRTERGRRDQRASGLSRRLLRPVLRTGCRTW